VNVFIASRARIYSCNKPLAKKVIRAENTFEYCRFRSGIYMER
jgi:hypothetical protein